MRRIAATTDPRDCALTRLRAAGCPFGSHAHYVRNVTLVEDANHIRTRAGITARIRSVALNVLRANGVQNISLALYANAVSFDHLLTRGTA